MLPPFGRLSIYATMTGQYIKVVGVGQNVFEALLIAMKNYCDHPLLMLNSYDI
ncbi:hypothetical protein [Endozoicomonas sp. 4G]|uniref:hypothetical protein n=1 Tax=Endozoicomonas sp. 4G TaxID=2872754 RepID=UPI002078E5D4|nr:hypothetical protein [Endozoicomonas sp. 4G]